MNLEQELRGLVVDWPDTPDLAGTVRGRIGGQAPRAARRAWGRPLAVALAVLVAATAAVLTFSPGARSALRDLFGIEGATVQRVEELPEAVGGERLDLGERVSLEEAEGQVGFDVRLPRGEEVDEVWLDRAIGRGAVTVVWCCPRVVLSQFRGLSTPYAEKYVSGATRVQYVLVNGGQGIWIEGDNHVVVFRDEFGRIQERPRLARNVLLWERGGVTFRLEGDFTKQRALALATRLR